MVENLLSEISVTPTLILFAIGALFYLILSAIYDRNGAEVPDEITLAYAASCICMATAQAHYVRAGIAALLIAVFLSGWKPRLLSRINTFLMRRAYKDEGEIQKEETRLIIDADRFQDLYGDRISVIYSVAGIFITTGAVSAAVTALLIPNGSSMNRTAIAVSGLVAFAVTIAMLTENKHHRKKHENSPRRATDREEISAFGGADSIILIGIFAAYGLVSFVFVVGASFMIHILLVVINTRVVKRENPLSGQHPLIPSLLIAAPARVAIAIFICLPIVRDYKWLWSEMAVTGAAEFLREYVFPNL